MAPSLRELLEPGNVALVTQECQNGVLGEQAVFPALVEAARGEVISNIARVVKAARGAKVPVVHAIAARRDDFAGYNANARLFGAARASGVSLAPGSDATQVIKEIGTDPSDISSVRMHGIGPMWGTDLDPTLRNLGVSTIVAVGVSVNVGITNLVMDAVNSSYQVVLVRDAVTGVPPEYAEQMIDNTLSLLATVATTDQVLEVWR